MTREVTVYSKTPCGQCTMTKRELSKKHVEYTEVEADQPGHEELADSIRERATALGVQGTMPYVTVHDSGGDLIAEWFGFQPDMINAHAAVRDEDSGDD